MVGNHSLSAERFRDRGGGHHRLLAALFSCKAIGSMLKSRIEGAPCPGVLPPIHRLCNFYKTKQSIIVKNNFAKLSYLTQLHIIERRKLCRTYKTIQHNNCDIIIQNILQISESSS